jgi:hypothetical protein
MKKDWRTYYVKKKEREQQYRLRKQRELAQYKLFTDTLTVEQKSTLKTFLGTQGSLEEDLKNIHDIIKSFAK